jgi:hypothetical protein
MEVAMGARPWRFMLLLAGLAILFPPAPGLAERAAWDQARVTQIAVDLAAAVEKVLAAADQDPEQGTVIQERQRQAVIADIRSIRSMTSELATKLKRGAGYNETRPIYNQIQTVRRLARAQGRKVLNPESTVEVIVTARELLEKLAPYYED